MIRRASLGLAILAFAAVLAACGGGGGETEARPADFTITYSWRDGSVAPEFYSEYEITIGPGGEGVIRYTPTYPGDGVPVWERTFALTPAQLDELYRLARADDAIRNDWQTEPPPIGGPSKSATIVADGQTYEIPADLTEEEATSIGGLYPAVDGLVPTEVRDELEAMRSAFLEQP